MLHTRELIKAGKDKRTKSFSKIGFFSNIAPKCSFTSLENCDVVRHITSCVILEIVVAKATPTMPSFGAPKRPKIKTAFKHTFKSSVKILM